ncbi:hypothetical protein MSAN_01831100 [Mycena sanguinolenta]|uniref:F-box domain-containing protein n=1 Tax=Mycena sanguinolenta TaxID=230812 RepID=A0A8H6XT08_9AGAR|nr:hypothetical protein MSAN_01831100 [Mycena sanguinolenta]
MLWSSLHISLVDYTPPHILLELERIVAAWLERSATCPLSISLSKTHNYAYYIKDMENHPLVLQLIAVSRRLRSLGLAGDGMFLGPLLQLGPEDVPLLQKIHIANFNQPSAQILQAPTLSDIALVSLLDDPLSLPLPWSLLRSFRFDCHERWTPDGQEGGLDFETALDVLRQCPNLEQCEFRINKTSEPLDSGRNLPSVIMPQLHALILKGPGIHLANWIPDLVVPKLRFLRIGDKLWDDAHPSTPGALSVDLDPLTLTLTSLHEILRSFPTISHLRLWSQTSDMQLLMDDEILAWFCPPHNLCPMLTELTFAGPAVAFSDAAALALIQARMAMATPLRRFRAEFIRKKELDIIPELQSFISDGLRVTLEYPPLREFKARAGLDVSRSIHF